MFQYTTLSQIEVLDKNYNRAVFEKPIKLKSSNHVKEQVTAATNKKYRLEPVWVNITFFTVLHIYFLYGMYLAVFGGKLKLFAFMYIFGNVMAYGITAGAHRLWAHRCYKARLPLELLLLFFQTSMFQNSVFVWVRDHRLHHKYTDTDADPHNAKRGFFFSHIGWLLVRKHPDVIEKGRTIDMSDIKADKLLMFQHKYYAYLMPVCSFVLPAVFTKLVMQDTWWMSFLFGSIVRYTIGVNYTWLVNSAAHMWGMKPYDKNIGPVENKLVSFCAHGEGFHNYHHVFPWDYKTAELGDYRLNLTLAFINFCAKIGLAYDMKTVSESIIQRRIKRTGDGSWNGDFCEDSNQNCSEELKESLLDSFIWGWGDKTMDPRDVMDATIIHRR